MAGLILLLVLGTQILDWRWLTALVVLSIGAGFRKFRREIPSAYVTAQRIDFRLGLADSLSTAWFYQKAPARARAAEGMRRYQFEHAERVAAGVDLARAVPFALPRSIYAMSALVLVASSLFALRYGVARTLDLRPPLAALLFDGFHFFSEPQTAANKKREVRRAEDRVKQAGVPLDQAADRAPGAQGSLPGLSTEAPENSAEKNKSDGDASQQHASASVEEMNQRVPGGDRGSGSGEGQEQSPEAERSDSGPPSPQGDPSGRSSASQRADASRHESNGLLDKFRDAMTNLLSRLKSQPRGGDSQNMASNSKNDANRSERDRTQNGSPRSGKQADGSPNGQSEGDPQGEGDQKAQSGPGKQGGSDAEEASRQGHTGIGKSDGSKDVREAEQLAAMGKISEIIGKRSQNLTGEVMVEVASGKQGLRTAYSHQAARHTDAGGEIHRDEIPLAYQRYVQQYFEEIRKPAKTK